MAALLRSGKKFEAAAAGREEESKMETFVEWEKQHRDESFPLTLLLFIPSIADSGVPGGVPELSKLLFFTESGGKIQFQGHFPGQQKTAERCVLR